MHGHSSHHPKAVEVHRGRLILYGCGDFLNDYEGIRGHERYRPDLTLMYLPTLEAGSGRLEALEMVPLRIHRLRLTRPMPDDLAWMTKVMDRECGRLGHRVEIRDGRLHLQWR